MEPSDARCWALLAHSTEIILLLDSVGTVTYCSAAIQRTLGYVPEDVVGKSLLGLTHAEDHHRVRGELEKLVSEAAVERSWTFRLLGKSGNWRHISANARNLLDEFPVDAIILGLRDVTETHEMERQLRHVQKTALLGRLVAGIVHDFNNLITIVLAYAELMAKAPTVETTTAMVKEIRDTGLRASSLSRQLSAFSQRLALHPEDIDLNGVLSGMHRLLSRVFDERIGFEWDLDSRAPHIRIDVGSLEQVLINLAINASDAMPDGGRFQVMTRLVRRESVPDVPHDGPDSWVRLSVIDSGIGMDEELSGRLFEPFFTTKSEQGSGLGLATVHRIVMQAGGRISVHSVPGRGTTFDVFFPEVPAASADADRAADVFETGGIETVILVEDDDNLRRSIVRLLHVAGYTVVERSGASGESSIDDEQLRQARLLIVDARLAETSGHSMADEYRRSHPDLAVLYISGYGPSTSLLRALKHGVSDFLAKPFDAKVFLERVRQLIDRSQSRDRNAEET